MYDYCLPLLDTYAYHKKTMLECYIKNVSDNKRKAAFLSKRSNFLTICDYSERLSSRFDLEI